MNQMKEHNRVIVSLTSFIIGSIICAVIFYCEIKGHYLCEIEYTKLFLDFDNYRIDIYLAQISLTFITVSLLSQLSDHPKTIYWVDIVESRLITPMWTCFFSYSVYSFTTLIFSTISIFISSDIMLMTFFILNCIVLVFLSFNMMDVYYNQENQKKKLDKQYNKIFENYIRPNMSSEGTPEWIEYHKRNVLFNDIHRELFNKTLKAFSDNDSATLMTNLEFYTKNCLSTPLYIYSSLLVIMEPYNARSIIYLYNRLATEQYVYIQHKLGKKKIIYGEAIKPWDVHVKPPKYDEKKIESTIEIIGEEMDFDIKSLSAILFLLSDKNFPKLLKACSYDLSTTFSEIFHIVKVGLYNVYNSIIVDYINDRNTDENKRSEIRKSIDKYCLSNIFGPPSESAKISNFFDDYLSNRSCTDIFEESYERKYDLIHSVIRILINIIDSCCDINEGHIVCKCMTEELGNTGLFDNSKEIKDLFDMSENRDKNSKYYQVIKFLFKVPFSD